MSSNALIWFEIPVENMQRAQIFYGTVLGVTFETFDDNYYFLKNLDGATNGALYLRKSQIPTGEYPILCFNSDNCGDKLNAVLAAGGAQVKAKTKISDTMGYFCQVRDTEGNTIAFWSQN